ncbi:MAG: hypothetical protein HZC40_15715 [Chloroflexi bacterium]|nr:hypothetical protein [Chloroflexota bacterium]
MFKSTTRQKLVRDALFIVFAAILAAVALIVMDVRQSVQSAESPSVSDRAAARDQAMVLQELERERFDQLNASASLEALRARIAASQDLQMVMRELERERFPQVYAKAIDAASVSCLDARVSCDR